MKNITTNLAVQTNPCGCSSQQLGQVGEIKCIQSEFKTRKWTVAGGAQEVLKR